MTDISEGIALFNNGYYFESHDYFEHLWIGAEHADRLFFQGMVQISVGCYHLGKKNYKGSLSQFTRGISKLEQYPEYYNGINLSKLIDDTEPLRNKLKLYFNGEIINFDNINCPEIEYNNVKSTKE